MNRHLSDKALQNYLDAPSDVQKAFDKQTAFLLINLRHPSLHAKKYDESEDIWQARINKNWRFYFIIENDTYKILKLTIHTK